MLATSRIHRSASFFRHFEMIPLSLRAAHPSLLRLWKVEQFVFDLLPYARTTGLVVVSRAEEYAPVKQSSGPDSLESAREALLRLYRNWLERAGATPADPDCLVEISPLYALDADDVSRKLPQGFRYHDGLVLREGSVYV
jgi:UDP-N-acetylglucosamine/UDP-N-acetylgalactosamine diphosphorylase